MDYTTAVQNDNKQPRQPQDSFFTSGVGTNDVDNNSFDSEKNLDLSNQSVEWSNPAERNPENVGIAAIESLGLQNTPPENKDHDIFLKALKAVLKPEPGSRGLWFLQEGPGHCFQADVSFSSGSLALWHPIRNKLPSRSPGGCEPGLQVKGIQ